MGWTNVTIEGVKTDTFPSLPRWGADVGTNYALWHDSSTVEGITYIKNIEFVGGANTHLLALADSMYIQGCAFTGFGSASNVIISSTFRLITYGVVENCQFIGSHGTPNAAQLYSALSIQQKTENTSGVMVRNNLFVGSQDLRGQRAIVFRTQDAGKTLKSCLVYDNIFLDCDTAMYFIYSNLGTMSNIEMDSNCFYSDTFIVVNSGPSFSEPVDSYVIDPALWVGDTFYYWSGATPSVIKLGGTVTAEVGPEADTPGYFTFLYAEDNYSGDSIIQIETYLGVSHGSSFTFDLSGGALFWKAAQYKALASEYGLSPSMSTAEFMRAINTTNRTWTIEMRRQAITYGP
ncbi:hypothetical protein N9104_01735 [Pseudomonadales bacterium]|nr:hypothetical protein [Pseudomonadales bacterium]